MKACQKCLSPQDFICLDCGGCGDCCRCSEATKRDKWVHVASKEGSIMRNRVLTDALRKAKGSTSAS